MEQKMTTFRISFLLHVCLSFASLCMANTSFGPPFTSTLQPNQKLQPANYSAPSEGYLPAYVLIYPLGRFHDPPSQQPQPYPPAPGPVYNANRPMPEPYPLVHQSRANDTTPTQSESLFSRFLSKLLFWRTNPIKSASTTQSTIIPTPTPVKYWPFPSTSPPRPWYTTFPETFKNPTRSPYSQPHPDRVKYYQYAYVVPMMDPGSKYLYLTYYPSYVQQHNEPPHPQTTASPTIPPISLYIPKKPTYFVPDEPFRPIQPNFKTHPVPLMTTEVSSQESSETHTTAATSTNMVPSVSTLLPTASESGNSTVEGDDIVTAPNNGTVHRARSLLFNNDQDWIPLVPLNA